MCLGGGGGGDWSVMDLPVCIHQHISVCVADHTANIPDRQRMGERRVGVVQGEIASE